jgi:hypothetical protein
LIFDRRSRRCGSAQHGVDQINGSWIAHVYI